MPSASPTFILGNLGIYPVCFLPSYLQLDGTSCGLFVCAYAELLARGVTPERFRFAQVRECVPPRDPLACCACWLIGLGLGRVAALGTS